MDKLPLCAYLEKSSGFPGESIAIKIHVPKRKQIKKQITSFPLIKNDFARWLQHKRVKIRRRASELRVIANQSDSTPGVRYSSTIDVHPLDRLKLTYSGNTDAEIVCPFIRGYMGDNVDNKRILLWSSAYYLPNIDKKRIEDIYIGKGGQGGERSFIFTVPQNINRLELFFLFQKQKSGDSFVLNHVHLSKESSPSLENLVSYRSWLPSGIAKISPDQDNIVVHSPSGTNLAGCRYNGMIPVTPLTEYELRYNGYVESFRDSIKPLISGYKGDRFVQQLVWKDSRALKTSWSHQSLRFSIPNGIDKIRLYFLYESHNKKSSAFHLNFVSITALSGIDKINHDTVIMNILNKKKQILETFYDVPALQQKYKKNGFALGMDWVTTFNYTIPKNFTSDWYFIELIDNFDNRFYLQLIVKSRVYDTPILLLSNTNTHNAYNKWAGLDGEASFYRWSISTDDGDKYKRFNGNNADFCSFDRPDPFNSADIKAYDPSMKSVRWSNRQVCEMYFARWMEKHGYNYHVITDSDMKNNPEILLNYQVFIIHGHPEYWFREQMVALNRFRDKGGNIMYLSGNGLYWKITEKDGVVEIRKGGDLHLHDGLPGGVWRVIPDQLAPYDTTSDLINEDFKYFCNPNVTDIFGAPYRILKPDHWIFNGITSNLIGKSSLNSPIDKFKEGKSGASGYETDQDLKGRYTVIAKGINPNNNGAHMIYREVGKSKIFSVGSIAFTGSLWTDEDISRIVKRVLDRFLID